MSTLLVLMFNVIYAQKISFENYDTSPCTYLKDTVHPTILGVQLHNCAVPSYFGWHHHWDNTPNWEMTDHSIIDFDIYFYQKLYELQQIIFGWHNQSDIIDITKTYITITTIIKSQPISIIQEYNVTLQLLSYASNDGLSIQVNEDLSDLLISKIKFHVEWNFDSSNYDGDGVWPTYIALYGAERTFEPTNNPTTDPTIDPTNDPTIDPTVNPTTDPTIDPTKDPTIDPTIDPTTDPTIDPTADPTTGAPTSDPTKDPTIDPTKDPTIDPTVNPTTGAPTSDPTKDPTVDPTKDPTIDPTFVPTTGAPTSDPTADPTYEPTEPTTDPTNAPTSSPTLAPSLSPTSHPTFDVICNYTKLEENNCEFQIQDAIYCCSYLNADNHNLSALSHSFQESELTKDDTLRLITNVKDLQMYMLIIDCFLAFAVIILTLSLCIIKRDDSDLAELISTYDTTITLLATSIDILLTFSSIGVINDNNLIEQMSKLYEYNCYNKEAFDDILSLREQFGQILTLDSIEATFDIIGIIILLIGKFKCDSCNDGDCKGFVVAQTIYGSLFSLDCILTFVNFFVFVLPSYQSFIDIYNNQHLLCYEAVNEMNIDKGSAAGTGVTLTILALIVIVSALIYLVSEEDYRDAIKENLKKLINRG